MYQKLLVPLDGSEYSECILEHVRAIASGCQVPEVVLLRVIEPWSIQVYGVPESFWRKAQEKAKAVAEDYLAKMVDGLSQGEIVAETAIVEGDPADVILDYAEKNGIDLITMSTHGRAGVSRWTFGSVADRVIRESSVPVLIAPPPGCRIG